LRVLAVDIGTTNVKAAVVDENGKVLHAASRELTLISPEPGAAEHSPREILAAVEETSKLAARGFEVDAVALSCYQHGLMVVDSRCEPLTNALTHMDWRAARYVAEVEKRCDPTELYRRTGCPPLFVYALPKILWLKSERPGFAAARFLLVKDFVIAKAVGEPYVDYGNASGSQLFNIRELRWDDLALEVAGLSEEQLAEPVEGSETLCELPGAGAELFSVKPGTPLVPGTFDGAAQNLGLGAEGPEEAVLNLGTTAVVRLLGRTPVLDEKGMRTFCYYAAAGRWAFGGSTNNGGSVLRWLRDALGGLEVAAAETLGADPYDLLCAEAERAPPGSSGLVFIPFMAGERFPFRDPYARGVLLGLRYDHRKPHVVRAFMEGVAMVVRAIAEALADLGFKPARLLGCGGGLRSRLWAAIVASSTRTPVARVRGGEHASNVGAAALAFKALGAVRDLDELGWRAEVADVVQPDPALAEVYDVLYEKFTEAYRLLAPFFREWGSGA
jgi:gluconokinase